MQETYLINQLEQVRADFNEDGLTEIVIKRFQAIVLSFYEMNGRKLPWRGSRDPYLILLSELMSQQTQIERVVPKFQAFVERFSSFKELADAHFSEILGLWSGLGYNRRAKYLWETATMVSMDYGGSLPDSYEALVRLPGIGSYTANAVLTFAFDKPVILIETNVRTVYFFVFFMGQTSITDASLRPLVEKTLYKADPVNWYNGLMDVGSVLKLMIGNLNKQSSHYNKQSSFHGSDRQIRGQILRILLELGPLDFEDMMRQIDTTSQRLQKILDSLVRDTMIEEVDGVFDLV